jgi:hypothetical protein
MIHRATLLFLFLRILPINRKIEQMRINLFIVVIELKSKSQ